MFTQGLDKDALKWVREGSANRRTDVPVAVKTPLSNARNGGRTAGLPPPKFRSGRISGTIPVSSVTPSYIYSSDNDTSTDTEEDIYSGRYSLDSSPQDDRIPSSTAASRQNVPVRRHAPQYASDSVFSDNVNSSRETFGREHSYVTGKMGMGVKGQSVRSSIYTEDESSDSGASSEFSSTQVRSNHGNIPPVRTETGRYASGVPSKLNMESATDKDDDMPSAPPFTRSGGEVRPDREKIPASEVEYASSTAAEESSLGNKSHGNGPKHNIPDGMCESTVRTAAGGESAVPSSAFPTRLPTFHASALGPWHGVIAYDACVRLCLHAWAKGCMEAPMFLENECALLRDAFNVRQVLLQSEEELLSKQSIELGTDGAALKPKKMVGKMKVQVKRVKVSLDPPTGCISSIKVPKVKIQRVQHRVFRMKSAVSSGWKAFRKVRFTPRVPQNGSFSHQSLAYFNAGTNYVKQVSGLLKVGVTTLRSSSSSYDAVQETYSCVLRLKSSTEEEAIRMQPGSGETHVFFPDGLGDDLIVEVLDSKGNQCGRVLAQVATVAEDPGENLRWWSMYHEPEHELVGRVQLFINYSTSVDENNLKCGSVAETVAYDLVLEVAMKIQRFHQRNLVLHGPWKWILTEFASYYGVSDAYTKLRYLAYVMDVATPTAECLTLVYDLLLPVLMKGNGRKTLSHQENRILGEIEEQLEQIFDAVFQNYKSLDESSPSGIMEFFGPATGLAAPVLKPAVELYSLFHDILSPEAQNKLYSYFQAAAKKRSRRHLSETDEYVSGSNEGLLMDVVGVSTAYQKMKSLCLNIRNETFTDIEIHNQHILPSFIDLPNLSAAIYSAELCNRLRAFLIACPPTGPSPPVTELVIATDDFQRDLASWNIKPVKGGLDAKELFHLYIVLWIQDKRLALLESCKLDKVKWSGVRTQHSTTPFIDDMYDRLKETLNDYDVIISRWPEYTFVLENAVADIEKAIIDTLEKQYADVLSPLKESLAPKKFDINKYVQKLAKRSVSPYVVPDELGILLNSMKRILDALRPRIEQQLKSWGSCIPEGSGGNSTPGERLSEVAVMLRSKFRNYVQAVVEKLAENTKLQGSTKLKKILQDSKDSAVESDIRSRMQPLKDQLVNSINHLHSILETRVFISCCRGLWDKMGQDLLSFLESRKENRAWYKGSRVATSVLDDTFASQIQQLLGNSLQEKDLEPPRSIMEVRSILCKDAPNNKGNSSYYY